MNLEGGVNVTVPGVVPDNGSGSTSPAAAAGVVVVADAPMIWGAVALSLIVVATAFGNILLCAAVMTEQRLQNMTNYFLASLAVADLLVAVIVMPLAVVVQIYGTLFIYVFYFF